MSVLRTIEKGIRRLIIAGLTRNHTITPDDPAVKTLPERPRILLVRIDRIGDGIISTPSLQSLRERFPNATIDILLGAKNRVLAPLLPYINQHLILEKGAWNVLQTIRAIRRNQYDVVINLHLNKSASAGFISRIANGNITVEYGQDHPFSTDKQSNRTQEALHVVAMTSQLLAPLGISPLRNNQAEEYPLTIVLPSTSIAYAQQTEGVLFRGAHSGRRVFLNVSASHVSRSWPSHCFAELVVGLRQMALSRSSVVHPMMLTHLSILRCNQMVRRSFCPLQTTMQTLLLR